MNRTCSKPSCSLQAGATLIYDYGTRRVMVDGLAPSAHPMTYDLCDDHADRLTVPQGWDLIDRRVSRVQMVHTPTTLAS